MTAPLLTREENAATSALSLEIGRAFARARARAGEPQKRVARRLGCRAEMVQRFENGHQKNLKLGTIVRNLGIYRLGLAIIPKGPKAQQPSPDQAAAVAEQLRQAKELLGALEESCKAVPSSTEEDRARRRLIAAIELGLETALEAVGEGTV